MTDILYAFRGMRKHPGFTAVAVMTLALGIGVNAAVFDVANAVLFKGFPGVAGNDRLLYITSRGYGCCVSFPDFVDWRAQATSFAGMAAVRGVGVVIDDEGGFAAERQATEVTANAFALVGRHPSIGRDFTSSDEQPGAAKVAILSDAYWASQYGRDPSVLGRAIRINGAPATIVGVMPPRFSFPQTQDLWLPLVPTPELEAREARSLWVAVGRLADGATVESARAEMAAIGRRLAAAYPRANEGQPPVVQTFPEFFIGQHAARMYGSMWGAVAFVLLIACANVANLMLARAMGRSREIAVRVALGAGRWRIARQLLVESLMLSSLGGVAAWWLAKWGVEAYALAMASKSPWLVVDYSTDGRVLAYFVAVSVGTGLLFGLAPASRLSGLDVNDALKDGGRATLGRGRQLSSLLVAGEMALAVVLIAGAGVTVRSFLHIYSADLGVTTDDVIAASVGLPRNAYPDASAQRSFFDRLEQRIARLPGVESVSIAQTFPTGGARKMPFETPGAAPLDAERRPTVNALVIGAGYFHTLGASLVAGRDIGEFDDEAHPGVAIVNENFANRQWPGEDALGQRFRVFDHGSPGPWTTVVGVASNIIQDRGVWQNDDPMVYLPFRQHATGIMWVFARTRVEPGSLVPAFRREVRAMDAELPIFGPFRLADRLETLNDWSYGVIVIPFLVFAAIALLLASVGLYGVVSHAVGRRTQEIGIRIAIGASARDIAALVLRQGIGPLLAGLAIGLVGSLGVNRILVAVLVQVSPGDPLTLVATSGVLVAAAILGCLVPARRAMRMDPVVALRHE